MVYIHGCSYHPSAVFFRIGTRPSTDPSRSCFPRKINHISQRALNIERGCLILKQLNRHFNKQKEGRMRLGRECRVKNRRNMENINCRRLSGSLHQLSAYLYLWNMQERVASKINIAAPSVEQSVHNFIRARHSSGNFGFFQCSFFRVCNSVASGEFIEWVF